MRISNLVRRLGIVATFAFSFMLTACGDKITAPAEPAAKPAQKWVMAITAERGFMEGGSNIIASASRVFNNNPIIGYGIWGGGTTYIPLDSNETTTITHALINIPMNATKVGLSVTMQQTGNALNIVGSVAAVHETVMQSTRDGLSYLSDTTVVKRGKNGQELMFNLLEGALRSPSVFSYLDTKNGVEAGCANAATSFLTSDEPRQNWTFRNGGTDTWRWQSTTLMMVRCYSADNVPFNVALDMSAHKFAARLSFGVASPSKHLVSGNPAAK